MAKDVFGFRFYVKFGIFLFKFSLFWFDEFFSFSSFSLLSEEKRRAQLAIWQSQKCLRTALSFSLPESDSERFVFAEYGKRIKVEFISYGLEDINGP